MLADGVGDADDATDGAELTSASEAGGLDDAAPESIPEAPAASSRTSTRPPSAAAVAIIRLRYVLSRAPATAGASAAGATVSSADVAAGAAATTGTTSVGGAATASSPTTASIAAAASIPRIEPVPTTPAAAAAAASALSSQAPLLGDEGRSQRDRVLRIRIDRDRPIRRLADHLGNQRDP